ncbi:MAG: hypothetical protein ABH827_01575 [bacterium]
MKKLSFFTLTLTLSLICYNHTAFAEQNDGYESDNEDIAKVVSKSKSKIATKFFTTKLTQIAGLTDQISTNLLFLNAIEKEEKDAAKSFSQNIKRSLKKDLTELAKKTTFVIDHLFELKLFKKFKIKNSKKIQQLKNNCANIQQDIKNNASIENKTLKELLLLTIEVSNLTKEAIDNAFMTTRTKIILTTLTLTTITLIAAGFYFGWWKTGYTKVTSFEYKETVNQANQAAKNAITSIKESTKNAIYSITIRLQNVLKKLSLSGKTKAPIIEPVITDPVITAPVITDPAITDPVITDPVTLKNYDIDGAINCAKQCFQKVTYYNIEACTIRCIENRKI